MTNERNEGNGTKAPSKFTKESVQKSISRCLTLEQKELNSPFMLSSTLMCSFLNNTLRLRVGAVVVCSNAL